MNTTQNPKDDIKNNSDEINIEEDNILESEERNEKDEMQDKEIDILKSEVKTLNNKVKEYLSKFQRLGADFDNYKKRQDRDASSLKTRHYADIIKTLLPFFDTIKSAKESDKSGIVEKLFSQLEDLLGSKNIRIVSPEVGDHFDPSIHEALSSEYSEVVDPGCITRSFQDGFVIEEYVIRPARVTISEGHSPEEDSSEKKNDNG